MLQPNYHELNHKYRNNKNDKVIFVGDTLMK